MNTDVYDRIVGVNLILCFFVFWACACRLKMTSKRVRLSVRNRYVVIGTGSMFGGLGHWIFQFPGGGYVGLVLFVVSIAMGFWLDKEDWRHGPPPSATVPGALDEPSD